MSWDKVIYNVAERLPDFNNELLIGYKKRNVDNCKSYLEEVIVAVIDHINASMHDIHVDYVGYEVKSPIEQIRYASLQTITKGKYDINLDGVRLVEYKLNVTYMNDVGREVTEEQVVRLYLPYWLHNGVVLNGRQYYFKHVMSDIIVRIEGGVIIKLMRSPIRCFRNTVIRLTDVQGNEYPTAIVTSDIYQRSSDSDKSKTKVYPPLILYLLAEFGFDETMRKFDIAGSIDFIISPVDDPMYVVFQILPNLYVKAARSLLDNIQTMRIVASLVHVLKEYKNDTSVYYNHIKDSVLYKSILGKYVHGRQNTCDLAVSHAEKHLESLRTYLDKRTGDELDPDGRLMLQDIYDVLIYMFNNIDMWSVNYNYNDLFEKRLEGINKTLYFLVSTIFKRVYSRTNKKLKANAVASSMQIAANTIRRIYEAECADNPKQYNDNQLFTILVDKLRQSKPSNESKQRQQSNKNSIESPEHRFHPSFAAIESILTIVKGNPGVAGDINPFVQITDKGNFDKEATYWYAEIEGVKKCLAGM